MRAQTELTGDERAQLAHLCMVELTSGDPSAPATLAAERRICLTIVSDSRVTGAVGATARRNCAASGQIGLGPPRGATSVP